MLRQNIVRMRSTLVALSPAWGGTLLNRIGMLVLPVLAFTAGEMFFAPAFGVVGADLAPPAQRGAYMGWLAAANGLGYVVGPFMGGELLHLSPLLCWGTLLLVGVLGAGLAATAPHHLQTHSHHQKEPVH